MADCGVSEDRLEIMTEQGDGRTEDHRDQPRRRHQIEPQVCPRQHRPEAGQQEHARLHHGRAVQIGADRRRSGHGVGQPEVKWELRRLGEAAQQDQDQRHGIEGGRPDEVAARQYVGQFERSRDRAKQHQTANEREATAARHRQRHARALPPLRRVAAEADEQEGGQAGQFPEDEQQQDVARQSDAQHGPLKQQQHRQEPAHRVLGGQIKAGIDDDEKADAQDQPRKQQAQRIKTQADIQTQCRHPGHMPLRHPAAQHERREPSQQGKSGDGGDDGYRGLRVAARPTHDRQQQGAGEWQEAKQDQKQILLRVDTHAGTRMAGLSDDDDRLPHSYAGRQP